MRSRLLIKKTVKIKKIKMALREKILFNSGFFPGWVGMPKVVF